MENLSSLFSEAAILMLVGMGFVFVFLSILILAINLLAKLAVKFPDPIPQTRQPKRATNVDTGEIPANIVAAITSAVTQYRKNNTKK
jgi:oxaloacetate decarboxylase gamma subunit